MPSAPAFAPLWPLAAYGALGTLLLLEEPVAEASARLSPFCEAVSALTRSRLFHLLRLHPKRGADGEASGMAEEIRKNVAMVEESDLFLLPLGRDKEPVELLRSAFSRLLP